MTTLPVAVNTLVPVADSSYMLEHSRAQATLVSAALRPVLREAMVAEPHEVQQKPAATRADGC